MERHLGPDAPVGLFRPFQRSFRASMEATCTTLSTSAAASTALSHAVDRRDDYGQLLASGQVLHRVEDVVDVGAWRAEIRRQARADKISVRTGVDSGLVWALRTRRGQPVQRAEMHRYQRLLSRVAPLAVGLRHEPSTCSATATR